MHTDSRNGVSDFLPAGRSEPPFRYFLYDADTPVDDGDERLHLSLPLDRTASIQKDDVGPTDRVTYGDGFRAVRLFLTGDRMARTLQPAMHWSKKPIPLDRIREIHVRAEKHGAFYHPFRVTVFSPDRSVDLAVNLAVSRTGRSRIEDEFRLLQRMRRRFATDRIPRVFAFDRVRLDADRSLPLFLAEWFENHHEFHLHRDPADGCCKPALWRGGDRHTVFLTERQADAAYRGVAAILTGFYGLATTERVTPWHHAAGDFVLHPLDGDHVDVRMITLRGYRPMMAEPPPDTETALDALAVFLLDLSVRNRLDRLDGTGEVAWAADRVVDATVEGFAEALDRRREEFPAEGIGPFFRYLASYSPEDIGALFEAILSRFPEQAAEASVARRGMHSHVSRFLSVAQAASRRWQG
jgi:hypothetical protein